MALLKFPRIFIKFNDRDNRLEKNKKKYCRIREFQV